MEQNQNQVPPKKISLVDTLNSLGQKVLGLIKPRQVGSHPEAAQSTAQTQTAQVQTKQAAKLPEIKASRKIIIAVAAFLTILMLLLVVRLKGGKGKPGVFRVTPSPSPTATPVVEVPSQYADDEDVKRIQEKLRALDKDLNEAQFRDDLLRIPTLDWKVKFKD